MKKLIVLFFTPLVRLACENVNFRVVDEPAFQITIKQVTGRYIERADNQVERARRIVDKGAEIKNFIDLQPRSLDEIKEYFRRRIIANGPTDSDALLLLDLAELIEVQIQDDITNGLISEEQRITINNAIDLITDRARLYIP